MPTDNIFKFRFFFIVYLLAIALVSPGKVLGEDLFYFKGKINVNSASEAELQKLPFIGAKKAKNIVSYRLAKGPFREGKDLLKVEGVGEDTYLSMEPYISLSGESSLQYSKVQTKTSDVKTIVIESFDGPVRALDNNKYFYILRDRIGKAKDNITLCMYLFKTTSSKNNYSNMIMQELLAAAKRGVGVEVILEKNDMDNDDLNQSNRLTAEHLKRGGVKVRFDEVRVITHSKLVIIDKRIVFVGSHNLSHTALAKSNETSLMIESEELARYFLDYLEKVK